MTIVDEPESVDQPATELAVVLVVDDEPSVLSALTRLLLTGGVRVLTAINGLEALRVLEERAPSISVIISDYAMPGMNGAELLQAVSLRWPDITRVLLTGNADMPAAARAINEGHISRLYTKPWRPDELRQAVVETLAQHRALTDNRRLRALADEQAVRLEQWNQRLEGQVSERTLELERANASLQRGLLVTVGLLLTSLEHRLPQRAARCKEVARLAGRLAERAGMGSAEARRVQVAALVHDVGLTGLPDAVVLRRTSKDLSMEARAQYQGHSAIGQRMLRSVAALTDMAVWIRHHHERWDGRGYPDRLAGDAIPLPSRIIALADGYLEAAGLEAGSARRWREAQEMAGAYDPELLHLLNDEVSGRAPGAVDAPQPAERGRATIPGVYDDDVDTISVAVETLRAGMLLVAEVLTTSGAVLLRAGERITDDNALRIREFHKQGVLRTRVVAVAVGTLVTDSAPPIV